MVGTVGSARTNKVLSSVKPQDQRQTHPRGRFGFFLVLEARNGLQCRTLSD